MIEKKYKAFTLLELIVTLVVLGILTMIGYPSFRQVIYNSKYTTTVTEASAIGRDAMANARFGSRFYLTSTDFGNTDMNKYTDGVTLASGSAPWSYTSIHNITVEINDQGLVNTTVTSPSPSPTNSTLAVTSTDGSVTLSGDGTFTDPYNDVTLTRSGNAISIVFNRANWNNITANYGSIDTLFKTTGPSTVGVITKVSNNNLTVNPSVSNYTLNIIYNGSSSGVTYILV